VLTERSERVRSIFLEGLELEPSVRRVFLARVCDDDDQLRSEVEALLISAVSTENLAESVAWGQVGQADLRPGKILSGRFKFLIFNTWRDKVAISC